MLALRTYSEQWARMVCWRDTRRGAPLCDLSALQLTLNSYSCLDRSCVATARVCHLSCSTAWPLVLSISGGWCALAHAFCSQGADILLAHGEDSGLPLQVLTSADEFAAVRSGLQALGIAAAEDRSGLVFTPLSTIEVRQIWSGVSQAVNMARKTCARCTAIVVFQQWHH